jgi:hypothetical protein
VQTRMQGTDWSHAAEWWMSQPAYTTGRSSDGSNAEAIKRFALLGGEKYDEDGDVDHGVFNRRKQHVNDAK